MMGVQETPARLFYDFCLDEHVPSDHLLRGIDQHLDLADLRRLLKPFYSSIGRPSIDPELMMRMLIVGYCMGIRSERRLCEEVHLKSGVSLVLPARPGRQGSGSLDVLEEPARPLSRERRAASSVRERRSALHGGGFGWGRGARGRCQPHRRRRQQAALGSKQGLET